MLNFSVRPLSLFLSTPSARRATVCWQPLLHSCHYFYPRPPRGGRRLRVTVGERVVEYFYPRPPRGGRRHYTTLCFFLQVFLSTPSSRRATFRKRRKRTKDVEFLSTPSARRATTGFPSLCRRMSNFYPRPPRGGRQQKQRENTLLLSHYTPPCTNCKEMSANQTAKSHRYLRKRLVFRCEASRKTMCAAGSHWPDIKKSARYPVQTPGAVQRARPWSGSCCPAGRTADCPRQGRSGRSALL